MVSEGLIRDVTKNSFQFPDVVCPTHFLTIGQSENERPKSQIVRKEGLNLPTDTVGSLVDEFYSDLLSRLGKLALRRMKEDGQFRVALAHFLCQLDSGFPIPFAFSGKSDIADDGDDVFAVTFV